MTMSPSTKQSPPNFQDLTGQRFGRLTVLQRGNNHVMPSTTVLIWNCVCDCGNKINVNGNNLRRGATTSCGCYRHEVHTTHGLSSPKVNSQEYHMLKSAKARAMKNLLPFNLDISDIYIPKFCPVFPDILLTRGVGKSSNTSATLDRLIPTLGYVKGNVRVISLKANRMKSDASAAEHRRIADWLDQELGNK